MFKIVKIQKASKNKNIIIQFAFLKIYDNHSIFQQKTIVSSEQEKNIIMNVIIFQFHEFLNM